MDDAVNMFAGDNVLEHFQRVFDGRSRVSAISGDQKVNTNSLFEIHRKKTIVELQFYLIDFFARRSMACYFPLLKRNLWR